MEEKLILLVDDEAMSLKLMGHYLSKKNIKYHAVDSGHKAIQYLDKHYKTVHGIVCDYKMPGWDGFATFKMIKTKDYADLPFVVVSGQLNVEQARLFSESGVAAIITKPITEEEFIKKIEKVILKKAA